MVWVSSWNNIQSGTETSDYDVLGRVTTSGRVTAGQANIGGWTKTTGV